MRTKKTGTPPQHVQRGLGISAGAQSLSREVGAFAYLVKGCSTELMRDVIVQAWRHGAEERWERARGL